MAELAEAAARGRERGRQLPDTGVRRGGDRRAPAEAGRLHRLAPRRLRGRPPGPCPARRDGWRRCLLAGPGSGAQPSLGSGALGDPRLFESSDRGDDALEEPLARLGSSRHFAVLPADEVTEHLGISGDDGASHASSTLLPSSRPRWSRARCARRNTSGCTTGSRCQTCSHRYPRRHGARDVRASPWRGSQNRPAGSQGRLEERFLPFLDRHRLPRPQFNVWLEVGGRRYQVDCLWPSQRQIVELDGCAGHGTRFAFREDRARDRQLRVAGYGVTRLTPVAT